MGALLKLFQAAGIVLTPLPGGRLRATGRPLNDQTRTAIREHKAAILAELSAANDTGTPKQARELRELVGIVAEDGPADEQAEALAVALTDPERALLSFRALAAERRDRLSAGTLSGTDGLRTGAEQEPLPEMRPCADCTNLSPGGRCLAAWRGESFGSGMSPPRDWAPAITDRPQRCLPYKPGSNDPDRRTGSERWPWLLPDTENDGKG